jgi:hypothetical protein
MTTMRSGSERGRVGAGDGRRVFATDEDHVADDFHVPLRQRSEGGARNAAPVRRLKQAWCHGQRISPSTTSPSASGAP